MNYMKKIIIPILVVAVIFLGVAFVWQNYSQESGKNNTQVVANNLWAVISKEDIVEESALVVWGKIINQDKAYKEKSFARDQDDIYTNQTVEVEQYLFNPEQKTDKELIIKHLGGTVGNTTLSTGYYAWPEINSYAIFILVKNKDKTYSIFGGPQGHYQTDEFGNIISKEFNKASLKDIFGEVKDVSEVAASFNK